MKYKIEYYYIKSDHILASPAFDHKEIVEAATPAKLRKYIEKQKDEYGHKFKKGGKKFGFDYTSNAGAVKVRVYKPPKIKKI